MRQDPDAAETLGVATTLTKTQALFLSACILGVAGSVYALHYLFISPDSVFGFSTSISLVIMPIIGGLGTVIGPLIGAVVYTFIREQFAATLANADLLAFGVLLIAIVVFEPRGILGIVDRIRAHAAAPGRRSRAPMAESILEGRGLTKRFGGLIAVNERRHRGRSAARSSADRARTARASRRCSG